MTRILLLTFLIVCTTGIASASTRTQPQAVPQTQVVPQIHAITQPQNLAQVQRMAQVFDLAQAPNLAQAPTLEFSHQAGFYTSPISLTISTDQPGATIRYTTDGSVPNLSSPVVTGPILLESREGDPNVVSMIPTNDIAPGHPYREEWQEPDGEVFKIHVIRARGYAADGTPGDVMTASFLVDPQGLDRYSLPVFSLAADVDDLFGDEQGIYVPGVTGENYNQRGDEWEREIHLEFFEADGERVLAQGAGVRIHGGTSRNRPRKTLRFYARSEYGESWFNAQLFPDKDTQRFKRFLLRNSGNDWSESLFRDALIQRLIQSATRTDLQYSRPVILFINGEYWGIHMIRDRFDDRYLQEQYDVDRDRISLLEGNGVLDDGNEEGVTRYQQMIGFILGSDMGDPGAFAQAEALMDMESFIDFQIAHIYSRNTDWPGNNINYWVYLDGQPGEGVPYGQDGRWRWMIYDTDFGLGLNFDYVNNSGTYGGNNAYHNTLAFALAENGPGWPNPPWSTALFRALLESPDFEHRFVTRFADLLNTNYRQERAQAMVQEFRSMLLPEIDEHIARWREPSRVYWESDISTIESFVLARESGIRNHIDSYFGLGGAVEISVDVNDPQLGYVKVNTVEIRGEGADVGTGAGMGAGTSATDPYPWSGTYFSGMPVMLVANATGEEPFTGWLENGVALPGESDTLWVNPVAGLQITALFGDEDGGGGGGGDHQTEYSGLFPEGWNMVSLPVLPENTNYLQLFPQASPGTLYGFNGMYELRQNLVASEGYWLYFENAANVTLSGAVLEDGLIGLQPGWNLIGGLSEDAVLNDPGGIVMPGTLYGYDGSYQLSDVLEAGRAYWLSASAAGTVSVVPAQ